MPASDDMLPVTKHAARLLEKVDDHRCTLVVGATGCGKSTQVPKLLRKHLKRRVLCVQPRRLAVVAVASRVAAELDEVIGGRVVGYHIGASCLAELDHTELMFVTAGIFLEDLKCNGLASLSNYGAVIIDEVHERSCENDLALACMVQLVQGAGAQLRSLKVILMSATADVRRYVEFVAPLCGDEGVATYALGDSATVYNIRERYLKDAIAECGYKQPPDVQLLEQHTRPATGAVCDLVENLAPKLVQRTVDEDVLGNTVLIFLPT